MLLQDDSHSILLATNILLIIEYNVVSSKERQFGVQFIDEINLSLALPIHHTILKSLSASVSMIDILLYVRKYINRFMDLV